MNIEYIIIQAGGMGTRLGKMTVNRPKALVPVKNLPVIFHLFNRFSNKKFIIICDYKSDVLERYLRTFAKAEYLTVNTSGKGNAAGVKDALEPIPDGAPFMLTWSDILFSEEYMLPEAEKECYVGVFDNTPCSWHFSNGRLEKKACVDSGVAGCFLFNKKEHLMTLPSEGSFTTWLSESKIPLAAMDMRGAVEIGTTEALQKADTTENRCRPYNHMEFSAKRVIKTGLTQEGKTLIEREARWYEKVSEHGFCGIPRIYNLSPLTMERIYGDNIFKAPLTDEQKKQTIRRLVDTLKTLHDYEKVKTDPFDLWKDYYKKTLDRIAGIREVIPFADRQYITINSKQCKNIFFFEEQFGKEIKNVLFDTVFGLIHGDCTLTNTMTDSAGNIYFIDARGYFGNTEFFGDVYYDWAKLYYSVHGSFDRFNIRDFELKISEAYGTRDGEVSYVIAPSGWEHLTEYFLSLIPECNISKIKLIHAIIWLSLASHCWEDYDSMCLAFYNGIYLWNEWMEENNALAI